MPRRQQRRILSAPSKLRSRSAVRSPSSTEVDPEIGKGVEALSDMGFQHPQQDRGLNDYRITGLLFHSAATSAAISAATLLG
jgi:hypothetical protein